MSKGKVNSLIVGYKGQDGTLLREQLSREGLSWLGIDRDTVEGSDVSLSSFSSPIDVSNPGHVNEIVNQCKPKAIYYLAANHRSSKMCDQPLLPYFRGGLAVNLQGPLNVLEAIVQCSPESRFLFVSSSLIFAPEKVPGIFITELSDKAPLESYAMEKMLAGHYCHEYRKKYHVFASVAIPFNHESVYRDPGFFTRDATDAIAEIYNGNLEFWEAGTLEAVVDWLHAGDVVAAMQRILQLERPDDFIVASGIGHTTGEFLEIACDYANIDFGNAIRVNPKRVSRCNSYRIGDSSKLRAATGWEPSIEFSDMVRQLMQAALDRSTGERH
ncbi:MAG: GDP-mannose 4,6-dehydratase [Phycisphaerae bacterium]|nr:GDP-mannose 4,6-dehydratase [Phycisphaerae bacterium]